MTPERRTSRIARWAVPAGAVAVTGILVAGFALSSAQAAPSLPRRTTVQLLAAINSAHQPPPMTAVVQESASLGLPDLPDNAGGPFAALSWLTGSHTFKIWYADPAHLRIAVPVPLGESDLRLNGSSGWLWNSQSNQVTHLVLPAGARSGAAPGWTGPLPDGNQANSISSAPSPDQIARQLLAAVGPTTEVSLQQNVMIAGQAAYQISLAPKDSRSLIGQIRIAVAASRSLPLRVQIFPRGGTSPAFQIGYTSLRFGPPAAANFSFTPPPGAKVKTVTLPSGPGPMAFGPGSQVPIRRALVPRFKIGSKISLQHLPKGAPKLVQIPARGAGSKRVTIIENPATGTPIQGSAAYRSTFAFGPGILGPGLGAGGPRVLGQDWLSVIAIPGPVATAPQRGAKGQTLIVPRPGGPSGPSGLALLAGLLRAATPVHGSWGSGRLLSTSLVSVLATDKGTILIGAVTPAVLYADAAQVK